VTLGTDLARVVPPAGARVEPYANDGYELRFVEGAVEVRVEVRPLGSGAPFAPPAAPARDAVARVARAATLGAATHYEAAGAILSWVAANVRYELDRDAPQEPRRVLERRRGYCTGIAKLTVALLAAVGIEAREVPGYRLEPAPDGERFGFHRWVEVFYPDRGWVFSDPMATHQFVPATYLRLADERLELEPGQGALRERRDRLEEVDLAPAAPPRVRVRPNDAARGSAALLVRLADGGAGEALLAGEGATRTARIEAGRGRFLGLAPGSYELKVTAGGRLAAWKRIRFRGPVLGEVTIPEGGAGAAAGGGGKR
jgi:hypothetical protein